jgi:predicted nucleotidyltransferase
MFTNKALKQYINSFLVDLRAVGYNPSQVVLFGSYASGKPHQHSDVDLAIWDEHFIGVGMVDIVPIISIVSKYPSIELHSFPVGETEEDDPFISEILRLGIVLYSTDVKIKTT